MNIRSLLFASTALLAVVSAQAPTTSGSFVGAEAKPAPDPIVIEHGDDRIVIGWVGGRPEITVNGSKVAAPKAGAKAARSTVIDGYKVKLPTVVQGYLFDTRIGAGQPAPGVAVDWSVPLAYHFTDAAGEERRQGGERNTAKVSQKRPHLGVQVGSVPAPLADHLALDASHCVLILSVTKGGPAEKAGLRKNDILLGVDGGHAVTDQTLRAAVGKKQPGDAMLLRILRRGEERDLEVEVGEKALAKGLYWGTVVDPKTLNGYWDASLLPKANRNKPRWDTYYGTRLPEAVVGTAAGPSASVQKELAAIRKQLVELKKLVAELRR